MRQYRDVVGPERSSAEDCFLARMRKNREANWLTGDLLHRGNYFFALSVGCPGINDDNPIRPDDECDVCGASAIFLG